MGSLCVCTHSVVLAQLRLCPAPHPGRRPGRQRQDSSAARQPSAGPLPTPHLMPFLADRRPAFSFPTLPHRRYLSQEDLPDQHAPLGVRWASGWGYMLSRDLAAFISNTAHMYAAMPDK